MSLSDTKIGKQSENNIYVSLNELNNQSLNNILTNMQTQVIIHDFHLLITTPVPYKNKIKNNSNMLNFFWKFTLLIQTIKDYNIKFTNKAIITLQFPEFDEHTAGTFSSLMEELILEIDKHSHNYTTLHLIFKGECEDQNKCISTVKQFARQLWFKRIIYKHWSIIWHGISESKIMLLLNCIKWILCDCNIIRHLLTNCGMSRDIVDIIFYYLRSAIIKNEFCDKQFISMLHDGNSEHKRNGMILAGQSL